MHAKCGRCQHPASGQATTVGTQAQAAAQCRQHCCGRTYEKTLLGADVCRPAHWVWQIWRSTRPRACGPACDRWKAPAKATGKAAASVRANFNPSRVLCTNKWPKQQDVSLSLHMCFCDVGLSNTHEKRSGHRSLPAAFHLGFVYQKMPVTCEVFLCSVLG